METSENVNELWKGRAFQAESTEARSLVSLLCGSLGGLK